MQTLYSIDLGDARARLRYRGVASVINKVKSLTQARRRLEKRFGIDSLQIREKDVRVSDGFRYQGTVDQEISIYDLLRCVTKYKGCRCEVTLVDVDAKLRVKDVIETFDFKGKAIHILVVGNNIHLDVHAFIDFSEPVDKELLDSTAELFVAKHNSYLEEICNIMDYIGKNVDKETFDLAAEISVDPSFDTTPTQEEVLMYTSNSDKNYDHIDKSILTTLVGYLY